MSTLRTKHGSQSPVLRLGSPARLWLLLGEITGSDRNVYMDRGYAKTINKLSSVIPNLEIYPCKDTQNGLMETNS